MLFITRTGMYIGKPSKDSIISFVHGYEIGTGGKCNISNLISGVLTDEFGIARMATDWTGQIEEYSKQRKQNWIISFKQIMLKCFYRYGDFKTNSELKEYLKSRLQSTIGQLNLQWVASNFQHWYDEWKGLVDVKERGFKMIWSDEEWCIIRKLDNEINNTQIQLTNKLLELRMEYKNIIACQS